MYCDCSFLKVYQKFGVLANSIAESLGSFPIPHPSKIINIPFFDIIFFIKIQIRKMVNNNDLVKKILNLTLQ